FFALLSKQLKEDFNITKGKKFDVFGMLINLIISVAVVALVVLVFNNFISTYLNIEVDKVINVSARQQEILTFVYGLVIIAGVVGAIGQITYGLFENDDLKIYISLPLSPNVIVLAKIIAVYLKQIVTSAVVLVPFAVMIGLAGQNGANFYVIMAISCLFVPVVSVALATLLALPFYVVKRFVRSRFTINFVVTTALLALLFWGYSFILGLLEQILGAGELKYIFTAETVAIISAIAKWLVPAANFAALCFGGNFVINAAIIVCFIIFSGTVSYIVIHGLYVYITNSRLTRSNSNRALKASLKQHNVFTTLIKKEFNEVYRSYNYSYQYFSVAILMPLMVVLCTNVASGLLTKLLFVDVNFELCIFIIAIFGVLTNTFCATNVSREGQLFMSVKAMPIKPHIVIYAKVVFCMIVSFVSVLLAATALYIFKYLTLVQALVALVVGTCLAFAQICFATKIDFKNPQFSSDDDVEIKESNSTISAILFVGLLIAVAMGLLIVFFAITNKLQQGDSSMATALCSLGFALLVAGVSVLYLNHNLNKNYANFTGDKR
ncbi:MAG: hypothetical protein IJ999_03220, partial [Clostridia bacterium]|nr:hypothetical protein [Clostridia bacterium]